MCLFFILLVGAHYTNPNTQLIGVWISDAKLLLQGRVPQENWYGPTSAILMIPFIAVNNVFVATIFYALFGAFFYWKITSLIRSVPLKFIARLFPLFNLYLFRLIDSGHNTVFEFFLLTTFCYALIKGKIFFFNLLGVALGELRSMYWIIYLGICLFLFFSQKEKIAKKLRFLFVIPALISVLTLNFILYGVASTAGSGGYTAFFTNNKSSYITGNSFFVDSFAFGEAGPMTRRCDGLDSCSDDELYKKTFRENVENPEAFVFNLLQKTAIYFFEPQKVPRIPGDFYLNEAGGFIEIGTQRLSLSNVVASLSYFVYRSIILVFLWFFFVFWIFQTPSRKTAIIKDKMFLLILPWLFGSVTGIAFVAETRHWIVLELMLIPALCYGIDRIKTILASNR